MSVAREALDRVKQSVTSYKNINWEVVLETNYLHLLDRGATAIDVGANLGMHAWSFVHRLHCKDLAIFEPIPFLAEKLREQYSSDTVKVYEYALWKESGTATFYLKSGALGESGLAIKSFYNNNTKDDLTEITVQVRTLDEINLGFSPDFIKIDIEGAEIDMLAGALKTISASRPIISTEYGAPAYPSLGHNKNSLFDFAEHTNYTICDLLGNSFDGREDFLDCLWKVYSDFILIPNERLDPLRERLSLIRSAIYPLPLLGRNDIARAPEY